MSAIKLSDLITVSTFSRNEKKTTAWAYLQIKLGKVKSIEIDGVKFIYAGTGSQLLNNETQNEEAKPVDCKEETRKINQEFTRLFEKSIEKNKTEVAAIYWSLQNLSQLVELFVEHIDAKEIDIEERQLQSIRHVRRELYKITDSLYEMMQQ